MLAISKKIMIYVLAFFSCSYMLNANAKAAALKPVILSLSLSAPGWSLNYSFTEKPEKIQHVKACKKLANKKYIKQQMLSQCNPIVPKGQNLAYSKFATIFRIVNGTHYCDYRIQVNCIVTRIADSGPHYFKIMCYTDDNTSYLVTEGKFHDNYCNKNLVPDFNKVSMASDANKPNTINVAINSL